MMPICDCYTCNTCLHAPRLSRSRRLAESLLVGHDKRHGHRKDATSRRGDNGEPRWMAKPRNYFPIPGVGIS